MGLTCEDAGYNFKTALTLDFEMADAPEYEAVFSYRVHFGREKKIPGWGSVVHGEEYPLSAQTYKEAEAEFKSWAVENLKNPLIQSPKLIEVRYVKPAT